MNNKNSDISNGMIFTLKHDYRCIVDSRQPWPMGMAVPVTISYIVSNKDTGACRSRGDVGVSHIILLQKASVILWLVGKGWHSDHGFSGKN